MPASDTLRRAAARVLPEPVKAWLSKGPVTTASRRITTYDRRLLVNDVLRQAEADGVGKSIGYPAWNLLYYALLSSVPVDRPALVVETGTNHGLSTIALAQALRDGARPGSVVHTVDIARENVEVARENVEAAGLTEHVRFHVGDSLELLNHIRATVDRVDFAFLDAAHDYRSVMREFRVLYPLVRREGTVYFDNTSDGGVRKALHHINLRYRGNLVEFFSCSWWPPGNAIWQPRSYRRLQRPAAVRKIAR